MLNHRQITRLAPLGLLVALLLSPSVLAAAPSQKQLKIAYVYHPPLHFSGAAEDSNDGFVLEILRRIYEPRGYKLSFSELPYAKALAATENGDYALLASVVPAYSEKLKYPDVSIAKLALRFYVPAGSKWQYKGLSSMIGKIIGFANGTDFTPISPEFQAWVSKNPASIRLSKGPEAQDALAEMLLKKQIDSFVESSFFMSAVILKSPEWQTKIIAAGTLGQPLALKTGFAPTAANSKELVAIYESGLKALKADGSLFKIMRSYELGPQDL